MSLLRRYKEGQGVWARGALAMGVFIAALYAAFSLYAWLVGKQWLINLVSTTIPFVNIRIDGRILAVVAVLVPMLLGGIWAYNYPPMVDFLIDTENELKTRVTWPTRKELFNMSTVVVVAVIILGIYIAVVDVFLFSRIREFIYG
ncbi:MAG: preprotein translocase subunit SecE [Planctomycetes bacterium]|nr:preprotein translocase subunit SecE [Planctomycetota bacterium]